MFSITRTASQTHNRRVRMPKIHEHEGSQMPHPAARAPRIFADSAMIDDIRPLFEAGIINGVTTNPTLLKKAGASNWNEAKKIMVEILELLHPYPVSLELTELTPDAMIKQAQELAPLGENSVIKVPIGGYKAINPDCDAYTGLKVLHALWKRGIKTNATLIFNSTQAFWAANAGATYVSPFLGRLADYAYKNDHPERVPGNSLYWIEDHKNDQNDQNVFNSEYVASGGNRKDIGSRLIQEISVIFTNYDIHTEILAASFRNFAQLTEALLAGADILTVPTHILENVADHPLSDEGMIRFVDDSKAFDK